MSNVVFIQYLNPFPTTDPNSVFGGREAEKVGGSSGSDAEIVIAPLTEDISLDITTKLEPASSVLPSGFNDILQLMTLVKTASGTTTGTDITRILDIPIWGGTEPIKFSLKLAFYTINNPYLDVWRPIMGLASLCMLTPDVDNPKLFRLPGINFSNLKTAFEDNQTDHSQDIGTKAAFGKLISIEIPGTIYLNLAMVESAKPIFSKEVTESGFPLWGEIQLMVNGLQPANTTAFQSIADSGMARGVALGEASSGGNGSFAGALTRAVRTTLDDVLGSGE